MVKTVFQPSAFDYDAERDEYSQEWSYLQHKLVINFLGMVFSIRGEPTRHFRLEKVDRSPSGEIAGWRYGEVGGTGKVLIVND